MLERIPLQDPAFHRGQRRIPSDSDVNRGRFRKPSRIKMYKCDRLTVGISRAVFKKLEYSS